MQEVGQLGSVISVPLGIALAGRMAARAGGWRLLSEARLASTGKPRKLRRQAIARP